MKIKLIINKKRQTRCNTTSSIKTFSSTTKKQITTLVCVYGMYSNLFKQKQNTFKAQNNEGRETCCEILYVLWCDGCEMNKKNRFTAKTNK